MKVWLSLLAAGCAACTIEPGTEVGDSEREIVVPSTSRLDALPSPPRIFAAAAGLDSDDYHAEWDRLQQLGYYPLTLSSVRMPAGDTRFSSVFHKDANVETFYSYRGMTEDEYAARWQERRDAGYRVVDVIARPSSSGQRYDGAWVKETVQPQWASYRDMSRSSLDTRINEQRTAGLRPIRIHGYLEGSNTRYSAVFVKDRIGTSFRVAIDETADGFQDEFDANAAAGYYLVDKAAYPVGSSVRYAGVFAADSTVSRYASRSGMTAADFEARKIEYASQGYVMVDVEYYSLSTSSNQPRYSAIWLQYENEQVRSNMNLSASAVASWPADARNALAALRNRLGAYGARVGFVVEDLRNGNYLGYYMDDPFYLASTSKVLIAAAVLDRIDAGTLAMNQSIAYAAGDILESGDSPTAAGSFTVRQSLGWMINQSSTNATDRLVRLVGQAAINGYLRDSGIVDTGEITSICELDRRIVENRGACIRTSMSCFDFERWWRGGTTPPTAAGQACVASLSGTTADAHATYYATQANSTTPLQYARLWRRLLEADIISAARRDELVDILDGTGLGYMTGLEGVFFDQQGGKFGSKRAVASFVGMGYDSTGAAGLGDDVAEYSLSLFTEGWAVSDANETAAQDLMRAIATDALTILRARR